MRERCLPGSQGPSLEQEECLPILFFQCLVAARVGQLEFGEERPLLRGCLHSKAKTIHSFPDSWFLGEGELLSPAASLGSLGENSE